MGTRFEIAAYADKTATAEQAVAQGIQEIQRIEALISSWQPSSQTSAINAAAGVEYVRINPELYALIRRSVKVSELTEGAFDITAGGLGSLYRFEGQDTTLPAAEVLAKAVHLADYRAIEMKDSTQEVWLAKVGARIDFGGIGKGYAANRARGVMRAIEGVRGGVVNAAGDLATFGISGEQESWKIAISDPRDDERWLGQLEIGEGAVVTSGDYERYFTADGERYAHIVDPRTGLPTIGVRSASVVCSDAEVADALATALFVLGPSAGIELINNLRDIEGLVVDDNGQLFPSKGLILQPYVP